LNKPSKNRVAQWRFAFPAVGLPGNVVLPGLWKVTVVPTGTVSVEGIIPLVEVLSFVAVAEPFERAK
jgi:hypothetical protein